MLTTEISFEVAAKCFGKQNVRLFYGKSQHRYRKRVYKQRGKVI
jgi:hypothetical protein